MRLLFAMIAIWAATPGWSKGSLVIVGGGLSADNAEIYRAFIDRAAGGIIAIIPSSSGEPQASLDAFAANLVRHGVAAERIVQVRLAEVDDPATHANEAAWARNASNKDEIARIKFASAIWFTGGDQARTTRLLVRGGKDTPMLEAMRQRLASGAVIGGTSAGAAIMGTGMILCGDPKSTSKPVSRNPSDCAASAGQLEPIVLGKGLGFLPGYVVDQHFAQRHRLPRLLRAMACGSGWGIGIDEDTAVVVDLASKTARAIGRGKILTIENPRPRRDCAFSQNQIDVVFHESGQPVSLQK